MSSNRAAPDWEELQDEENLPPPPRNEGGVLYVDRTPVAPTSRKKKRSSLYVATSGFDPLMNEKTPLISHKSSSGLSRLDNASSHAAPSSIVREESMQSSFLWNGEDEDTSDNDYNDEYDDNRSIASWSTASSIVTLSTQYLGNFKNSLMIPFTDDTGTPTKLVSGLLALVSVGVVLGLIMPKDDHLTPEFRPTSAILGYTYMVCWSVCFYPQVLLNYKRKSTLGLSHDFAVLNLLGWTCFTLYECAMYFNDNIKQLYRQRFKARDNTVQSNDVVFAIHAMMLAWIYVFQIIYYHDDPSRPAIRIKRQTWILTFSTLTPTIVIPILITVKLLRFELWLDYFYLLSFLKISCTMTKYTKQVLYNIERQTTKGWNIWYNFLECVGGTLSMLQVVLDAIDMKDWTGVTGNMAKFALGFLTIFFDVLFFLQHYLIYSHHGDEQTKDADNTKKQQQDVQNMDINISHISSVGDLSLTDS